MLSLVEGAIGTHYTGYKGGEFLMEGSTEVHIAYYGSVGDEVDKAYLGEILL